MNLTLLLTKTTIVFFAFVFVNSFSFVEARNSVRMRKSKPLAPKHISISARSSSGVYARKYDYGKPIPNFSTKGRFIDRGRNRRYFGGRLNGKREIGNRNYANGFRTWTPNRNFPGNRKNPRIDQTKRGPLNKRKAPYPFLKEPSYGGVNKYKRRVRPQRPGPVRRPGPPKKLNEYDDDYYFKEEAKRGETKYEFENRYKPKKKRRNPGDFEKGSKKPDLGSKVSFYDEKPYSYKTKSRDPPISYSNFIQHPSIYDDEAEYGDSENFQYSQTSKPKKKRVKKKTSSSKKKNKEDEYYRPYTFEKSTKYENYPPYANTDEYEIPVKSSSKSKITTYSSSQDDDFTSKKNIVFPQSKPTSGLFSSSLTPDTNVYREVQNTQGSSQFSPSYSQPWSHSTGVETTARPVQYKTENGFQPQQYVANQYNRDYSSLQKTKTTSTNTQQATYYSQPDNTYKNFAYTNNYVSNQVSTNSNNQQTPSNYNYNTYSNSVYQPSSTYQQPVVPSNSDVVIQKSVPIYDNTETFYNYNNNAYVNSQSSKYFDTNSDNNQKYSTRVSDSLYRNTFGSEKTDTESEFLKKHQNLYNNGLSGVPVQGDGYGKDNRNTKKDYDIGYGDFQFDENPGS